MSSAVASRRGFSSFASIGFPLAFLPWTCAATCTSAHPFVAAGICRRAWIYKRWQNRRERRRPSSPRLPLHRRERNARRHVSLLRFSLCGLLSRSGLVPSFFNSLSFFSPASASLLIVHYYLPSSFSGTAEKQACTELF